MLGYLSAGFLAASAIIIPCAFLYGKFLLKKQEDELVGKFTVEINSFYRKMLKEKHNTRKELM
jgi:hypothetical protein